MSLASIDIMRAQWSIKSSNLTNGPLLTPKRNQRGSPRPIDPWFIHISSKTLLDRYTVNSDVLNYDKIPQSLIWRCSVYVFFCNSPSNDDFFTSHFIHTTNSVRGTNGRGEHRHEHVRNLIILEKPPPSVTDFNTAYLSQNKRLFGRDRTRVKTSPSVRQNL